MENYFIENFGRVRSKHSSEEALRRWRLLCLVVKNPKRRFRFTANISKRNEAAEAMRHSNQRRSFQQHLKIPLKEIELATNGFHADHLIGRGGFGGVYKAELLHLDVRKYVKMKDSHRQSMVENPACPRRKSTVAVKRLDSRYGQGRKQFLQEIEVLSVLNHQNIVPLLGFCDEDGEMILVYEYASDTTRFNQVYTRRKFKGPK